MESVEVLFLYLFYVMKNDILNIISLSINVTVTDTHVHTHTRGGNMYWSFFKYIVPT